MAKREVAVKLWPQICFHGKDDETCGRCHPPPADVPFVEEGPTRVDVKILEVTGEHSQAHHRCLGKDKELDSQGKIISVSCPEWTRHLAVYYDKRGNRKRETYCAKHGREFAARWNVKLPEDS